MGDFDNWVTLKQPFIQKSEASLKVINLLFNILPNKVLYRLGKYKNAYELWIRLIDSWEAIEARRSSQT